MAGRFPGTPKTGGRMKGVPNFSSLRVEERAEKLGVDPFEILLLFAKGDWKALGYDSQTETHVGARGELVEIERIRPEARIVAATNACQYLLPKRKAVEVTGRDGAELFASLGLLVQKVLIGSDDDAAD